MIQMDILKNLDEIIFQYAKEHFGRLPKTIVMSPKTYNKFRFEIELKKVMQAFTQLVECEYRGVEIKCMPLNRLYWDYHLSRIQNYFYGTPKMKIKTILKIEKKGLPL